MYGFLGKIKPSGPMCGAGGGGGGTPNTGAIFLPENISIIVDGSHETFSKRLTDLFNV